METSICTCPRPVSLYLETFLGGMETRVSGDIPDFLIPLETFLGGMETFPFLQGRRGSSLPLKPSLVEWKHAYASGVLSGLPALKPSLVEWKLRLWARCLGVDYSLKPSLVEWKLASGLDPGPGCAALKPSLVEWKLYFIIFVSSSFCSLKPSLVEWKPWGTLGKAYSQGILETFLGGMETGFPYS